MATTLHGLLPGSGEGEATPDSGRVTLKYLVESDSFTDMAPEVAATSGLPTGFSQYSVDYPQLRVKKISPARMTPNSKFWVVTVEYASPDKNTEGTEEDDPLDVRPELSVDYEEIEVPVWHTYDNVRIPEGTAVKNSAGWLFNPPFMQQRCIPVLTIKVNRDASTFGLSSTHASFIDCINADNYLGYPARTLRLANVKPVTEKQNALEYLSTKYVFKYNPYTWDLIPLDFGPFYYEGGKKLEFKTDDAAHEGNGLLNGSGGKSTTAHWLSEKRIYPAVDFDGLALPTNLAVYKYV